MLLCVIRADDLQGDAYVGIVLCYPKFNKRPRLQTQMFVYGHMSKFGNNHGGRKQLTQWFKHQA